MDNAGFARPTVFNEVLELKRKYGHQGKVLAGGTDLMVAARQGNLGGPYVIDITAVNELEMIAEDDQNLYIGALATHTAIINSPLVKEFAPVLAEAVVSIGSPQIRNRGTIGGNLANASPAADTLPALVVLNSRVTLISATGTRLIPVKDLISGPYTTVLEPEEVIYNIIVPKLPTGTRSKFIKVGRRNALAIARLSMAGVAGQEKDGTVKMLRIAPGSVFPQPQLITEIEDMFMGVKPTCQMIHEASKLMEKKVLELAGRRWSTAYKQPVCAHICRRVLLGILRGIGDE